MPDNPHHQPAALIDGFEDPREALGRRQAGIDATSGLAVSPRNGTFRLSGSVWGVQWVGHGAVDGGVWAVGSVAVAVEQEPVAVEA